MCLAGMCCSAADWALAHACCSVMQLEAAQAGAVRLHGSFAMCIMEACNCYPANAKSLGALEYGGVLALRVRRVIFFQDLILQHQPALLSTII